VPILADFLTILARLFAFWAILTAFFDTIDKKDLTNCAYAPILRTIQTTPMRRSKMHNNAGPTYREWLEVINHHANSDFNSLKEISKQIEACKDFSQLSEAQRARLLRKLGDLQIAAAQKDTWHKA
jgi:hypothetical protein